MYEKLSEMSGNDDYTTGNLLDFLYHQNDYKLIGIDLSRQTNTIIPQQTSFTGKLIGRRLWCDNVFLFLKRKFSLDSLIVTEQYNTETLKVLNLLNEASDSKFVTRK